MFRVLVAPNEADVDKRRSIFLAGGITNCPSWQTDAVQFFHEWNPNVLQDEWWLVNPRRSNFPIDDPSQGALQIRWEHHYLDRVGAVLFWFPKETLCPITLYELGSWARSQKKLFVGCHPDYPRLLDVTEQLRLTRPEIQVRTDLRELTKEAALHIEALG
jgi:hypothetical protein